MPGVAIFGITGRMGQSLVRALRDCPQPLRLSGALASASSGRLGCDAARDGADPEAALDHAAVAVDFSTPLRLGVHAGACLARRVPLLVGTTGFDAPRRAVLAAG